MKKIILTIVFTFIAIATFSQTKVGLQVNYATKIEFGVGAKASFSITDKIDIAPSFNYYFGPSSDSSTGLFRSSVSTSFFAINADGHYNFEIDDKLTVYPLAGINLSFFSVSVGGFGSASTSSFGLNLGGGLDYGFSEKLSGIFELKFIANSYSQAVFSAGVLYNF